jgi:hypothetical protein
MELLVSLSSRPAAPEGEAAAAGAGTAAAPAEAVEAGEVVDSRDAGDAPDAGNDGDDGAVSAAAADGAAVGACVTWAAAGVAPQASGRNSSIAAGTCVRIDMAVKALASSVKAATLAKSSRVAKPIDVYALSPAVSSILAYSVIDSPTSS